MKTINAKIGNMRKFQNFTIYPRNNEDAITVQSDTVIARISVKTGNAIFANVPGGAYFVHLSMPKHAKKIVVPMETVKAFLDAMPMKGDEIVASAVVIG